MDKFTLPLYKNYYTAFTVFLTKVNTDTGINYLPDLKTLLLRIERRNIHRGESDTIKFIKSIRNSIYRHVSGKPISISYCKSFNGLPSVLGPRLGLLVSRQDRTAIRQILTLLQISYLMKGTLVPKIDCIVNPSTADQNVINDIVSFSVSYGNKIFKAPPLKDWTNLHESTSAGPNGPAVWASSKDLTLHTDETMYSLMVLGGSEFTKYFLNIHSNSHDLKYISHKLSRDFGVNAKQKRTHRPTLRKVSAIPAPEGKTRVIGIFDYWSQTVLKPLHDWAFGLLKGVTTDMTFSQGDFKKILTHRSNYFSYDLTSATDRYPIDLQVGILSNFIGQEKAEAWKDILVGQDFTLSWDKSKSIKYNCGQPMGAYSSWAIFAITHHLVVRFCAKLAGFDPIKFTDYVILGDDLVIANTQVARYYETVTRSLGVEISEQKSLESQTSFEFAKRFFHLNQEYTAFPLAAIVENSASISAVWSVIFVAKERDFTNLDCFRIPGLCADFQRACGIPETNKFRKSHCIAKDLEALHQFTYAQADSEERWWSLFHLVYTLRLELPCSLQGHSIISRVEDDLSASVLSYQTKLLNDTSYKYINLRRDIVYAMESMMQVQKSAKGTTSQSGPTLRLDEIPIIKLMEDKIMSLTDQMIDMSELSESAQIEVIRFKVTPVGDLSRTISRLANTVTSSRQSSLIKFLRTWIANVHKERCEALSPDPGN
jgi:hypothetical protein